MQLRKRLNYSKIIAIGSISLFISIIGYFHYLTSTNALEATQQHTWVGTDDPIVKADDTYTFSNFRQADMSLTPNCTYKTFNHMDLAFGEESTGRNCFTQGADIEMSSDGWYGKRSDVSKYAAHFTDGSAEHQIAPGSNMLISHTRYRSNGSVGNLEITKDIREVMKPIWSTTYHGDTYLSYKQIQKPDAVFKYDDRPWRIGALSVSSNGKWLVAEVLDTGLVRIDLDTFEMKRFSTFTTNKSHISIQNSINFRIAVSNDGKSVATMGNGIISTADGVRAATTFYHIDNRCGDTNVSTIAIEIPSMQTPCPSRSIINHQSYVGIYGYRPATDQILRFSNDGGELRFLKRVESDSYNDTSRQVWGVIHAPGYTKHQLGYLAMGDSFSSGEGDTDQITNTNLKWYLDTTDIKEDKSAGVPREKCHISLRSYPYRINKTLQIAGGMKSIACSGATIPDVTGSNDSYFGQAKGGFFDVNRPRLEGYDNANSLKSTALNEFIPGRNKQIEFIKKYQPKAITLTMGGNDVGFGEKITSCVTLPTTCDYATEEWRGKLKSEIKHSYYQLTNLYKELYEASDRSAKIYVLGYPQFISADPEASCKQDGLLNVQERTMIVNSVEYMNNVIEQAANAAGVKYVDVEDALYEYRICEAGVSDDGVSRVTAITNPFSRSLELQESFHPNALGHEDIKTTFLSRLGGVSPVDYDICSNLPPEQFNCPDVTATYDSIPEIEYFRDHTSQPSVYKKFTSDVLTLAGKMQIETLQYELKPNSLVTVDIHSDPIRLGEHTVDASGKLDTDITLPTSLPTGYHTLELSGTSYEGSPITFSQIVEVRGANPSDIDNDGIDDAIDQCAYVFALDVDTDLDGIDDGCDPNVTNPQLYRVRHGDSTKQYNGISENENYVYIERNTRSSELTEVYGDFDTDSDGWAIVGASQGDSQDESAKKDYGDIQNFIVSGEASSSRPYVYITTDGVNCLEYTPKTLAPIKDGVNRELALTNVSANCVAPSPTQYSEPEENPETVDPAPDDTTNPPPVDDAPDDSKDNSLVNRFVDLLKSIIKFVFSWFSRR